MLIRSGSTPILDAWIPHSKDPSSPELEARTRSTTLTASFPSPPLCSLQNDVSSKRMTRSLSEIDIRSLSVPKKRSVNSIFNGIALEEKEEVTTTSLGGGLFSNPGLADKGCGSCEIDVMMSGGGKIPGRGGSDGGGGDGRWGSWEFNSNGNDSTDVYYQKMIEANPGNSILLGNYARFLKEVRGDFMKAEEYCERAILADPNDGNVLSMYANLVWQIHEDASRAESYFDQAVKAAPDDCYVLASYAHFLWDAEEEEDEDEVEQMTKTSPTSYFHGVPPPEPPPLAAGSPPVSSCNIAR
ncbi:hypothetical protein ACOSP7_015568 [Xanthoceras sorbifolium]